MGAGCAQRLGGQVITALAGLSVAVTALLLAALAVGARADD